MFNAVLTERLMRIQKAARRKIIHRWKLHGTRVSCNLACLKQWYLLILQWMKLKMFWAIPSFSSIQYSLSVHSAEHLEGGCPLVELFCQKCLRSFSLHTWKGKGFVHLPVWDCIGSRSHGWEWQKEEWKLRPVSWSQPGESGIWFMAAALPSSPLFSQPSYSGDWEKTRDSDAFGFLALNPDTCRICIFIWLIENSRHPQACL